MGLGFNAKFSHYALDFFSSQPHLVHFSFGVFADHGQLSLRLQLICPIVIMSDSCKKMIKFIGSYAHTRTHIYTHTHAKLLPLKNISSLSLVNRCFYMIFLCRAGHRYRLHFTYPAGYVLSVSGSASLFMGTAAVESNLQPTWESNLQPSGYSRTASSCCSHGPFYHSTFSRIPERHFPQILFPLSLLINFCINVHM